MGSDQKVAQSRLIVFQVMTPKSDFLLIRTWTVAPKRSMNTANFAKTSLLLSKMMNNK